MPTLAQDARAFLGPPETSECLTMSSMVIAVLVFALVAAVLALCREVRLRRALQRLLQLVLNRWRTHAPKSQRTDIDCLHRASDDQ